MRTALHVAERRKTRVVMVGDVAVGGDNPIRVQSMTTTRTLDTDATVAQTIRLVESGCEIVRITAPTVADARNLGVIRDELARRGVRVPLVADIHFSPTAALEAALHVDKVRINPGNFVDAKTFAVREYSDAEYAAELERIETRFRPVVLRCKERGVSMRIGTNHGSLSDRIMNRYGDTPRGMVESALEFLAICEMHGYFDVIFSMKASNPKVMIQAYRLLAARLDAMGKPYPFHLGVTEAGNEEDGRIKSAVGIGTLLEDGIGDTIRVSLTEEPEEEIPVAFAIARRYGPGVSRPAPVPTPGDPFQFRRRATTPVAGVGGDAPPAVVASIAGPLSHEAAPLALVRRLLVPIKKHAPVPDFIGVDIATEADVQALKSLSRAVERSGLAGRFLVRLRDPGLAEAAAPFAEIIAGSSEDVGPPRLLELRPGELPDRPHEMLALRAGSASDLLHGARRLIAGLERPTPLLLVLEDRGRETLLDAAIGLGGPLCDGIGDAVEIATPGDPLRAMQLCFNVLQAAGARISKTDYVACPSCGRTLFDLQSTTARIKSRTDHLSGLKIAIMGCVVNGPGEMADADFGYVGGAPGQVNLYVGKECVERSVPESEADDRLIALIKSRGRWVEPD